MNKNREQQARAFEEAARAARTLGEAQALDERARQLREEVEPTILRPSFSAIFRN